MADEHTPYKNRLQQQDYQDPALQRVPARPALSMDVDRLDADTGKVQQTMESQGWALIQKLLDDVRETHMRKLLTDVSNGRVLDQAEYASRLAFVAGLEQSRIAAESYQVALESARQALR